MKSKGIFTESENMDQNYSKVVISSIPVEEAIILSLSTMNKNGILPKALTIPAEKYIELLNNLGSIVKKDEDGDIIMHYALQPVKILCEDC